MQDPGWASGWILDSSSPLSTTLDVEMFGPPEVGVMGEVPQKKRGRKLGKHRLVVFLTMPPHKPKDAESILEILTSNTPLTTFHRQPLPIMWPQERTQWGGEDHTESSSNSDMHEALILVPPDLPQLSRSKAFEQVFLPTALFPATHPLNFNMLFF